MVNILGAVATVYGVYGALSVLMQARKMLVKHESCDMSLFYMTSYVGGYAVWLPYGLLAHSFPLIIADSVGLACGVFTLAVAVTLRGACQPVRKTP
jgi:uncharacterized protein with PQ loop repeat